MPKRFAPRLAATASLFTVVTIAAVAAANSGGRTRASGRDGSNCNSCHSGGDEPTVKLTGPVKLTAGTSATYTFTVESAAAITGMNAAATEEVQLVGGDNTVTAGDGEVTHKKPVTPDGGAATFTFSLTPEYGGSFEIYAAGNACNGDGNTSGDKAATTKLTVDVDGPARPVPEAGASTTRSDAGASSTGAEVEAPSGDGGADTGSPDDGGCRTSPSDPAIPIGTLALSTWIAAIVARRRR